VIRREWQQSEVDMLFRVVRPTSRALRLQEVERDQVLALWCAMNQLRLRCAKLEEARAFLLVLERDAL